MVGMNYHLSEFLLALICFLLALIPMIFVSFVILSCEFIRLFARIYLCLKHKRNIKLLNSSDALFLVTKQKTEVIITTCLIIQGNLCVKQIQKQVRESWFDTNQNNIQHPKLHNKIAKFLGYFYWIPETNFSVEKHVQRVNCKPPKNESEFLEILTSLNNQYFPQNISPWTILLLPFSQNYAGLENKAHYSVIFRYHHCLCDGYNATKLIGQCLLDEKSMKYLQPMRKKESYVSKILSFPLAGFYLPLGFARGILNVDLNILHGPKKSGKRFIRLSPTISLERIKRVGKCTETTVNDIMISCITGALQQFFLMQESAPIEQIQASIPTSMNISSEKLEFENNTYDFLITLPMKTRTNQIDRLKLVQKETKKGKASYYHLSYNLLNECLVNRLPLFVTHSIINFAPCTVAISNVPMYQTQTLTKLGDELKHCFAFSGSLTDIAITILILSYNGQVQISVSADTAVIKDVKLVDCLLKACVNEFQMLEQSLKSD